MNVLVNAIYGESKKESNLIYMLSSHLNDSFSVNVNNLACDGVFSLCDKAEKRCLSTCFNCMKEQACYGKWNGADNKFLGKYLGVKDLEDSLENILEDIAEKDIKEVSYKGQLLYPLVEMSLKKQVGDIDLNNKKHFQLAKRFLLSASRVIVAANKLLEKLNPELLLLADNDKDYISLCLKSVAEHKNIQVVIFSYDSNEDIINVELEGDTEKVEFIPEDLLETSNDSTSWPKEVLEILDHLADFMHIKEESFTKINVA